MPSLLLHSRLARAQLGGDLLVEQTGHDPRQDVPLAWGEGRVAAAQLGPLRAVRAHRPVALDRAADGVEEVLLAERLRQELHGAGLHGLDRHGDVAMPGEEDDWQCRVRLGQLAL